MKFSDLNPRLKNASEGSNTVKSWRVVVRSPTLNRSESVQCLYFCDISDIDWASWRDDALKFHMDGMHLDSILFPANTVLVAGEREI
jgi:hypothetical protein